MTSHFGTHFELLRGCHNNHSSVLVVSPLKAFPSIMGALAPGLGASGFALCLLFLGYCG